MKTTKYLLYTVLCPFVLLMSSCEPKALTGDDVFVKASDLEQILANENPNGEYEIYTLDNFVKTYMTEEGNFWSDTSQYRSRATNGNGIYLFSIDTLPTNGKGIYIRGRVTTDGYSGNFYKALVIQQVINGEQQNLRLSVDLGSAEGLYQMGQEIIIRCNGLAIGRYANQPQLCVPAYNNNVYADKAPEKVGWAPGRIPSPIFRRVTHLIGTPEPDKLKYDTLPLAALYGTGAGQIPLKASLSAEGMELIRKLDGRLMTITGICFTGQYSDFGTLKDCTTGNPDVDKNANTFAPTTENVGHPQSRVMQAVGGTARLLCSSSEYSKFAHHYLPGADKDGIADCKNWQGSVTGILGWYADNARYLTTTDVDGEEWSLTPRGIPGIGVVDIRLSKEVNPDVYEDWEPEEYSIEF